MAQQEAGGMSGLEPDTLGTMACCALCCISTSFYVDFPEFCGASCKGDVLCCNMDMLVCKPAKAEGDICTFITGDISCICPTTCTRAQVQLCCLMSMCALPCDTELMPCQLTILGITCCYKFSWSGCQACVLREDLERDFVAQSQNSK
jgi:hypothetical protein